MADIQVDVRARDLMLQLDLLRNVIDSREIITAERKAANMLKERGYEKLVATLIGNSDYLVDSFTYKLRGGTKALAGIRVGFKRPGGNVAHLVDLGTKERFTKAGAYRGRIKGSHFWSDTKDQYGQKAMDMMIDAIDSAIRKINSRT